MTFDRWEKGRSDRQLALWTVIPLLLTAIPQTCGTLRDGTSVSECFVKTFALHSMNERCWKMEPLCNMTHARYSWRAGQQQACQQPSACLIASTLPAAMLNTSIEFASAFVKTAFLAHWTLTCANCGLLFLPCPFSITHGIMRLWRLALVFNSRCPNRCQHERLCETCEIVVEDCLRSTQDLCQRCDNRMAQTGEWLLARAHSLCTTHCRIIAFSLSK